MVCKSCRDSTPYTHEAPTSPCPHFLPTSHPPGSEGKRQVMQDRASMGLPVFHPEDSGHGGKTLPSMLSALFQGGEEEG